MSETGSIKSFGAMSRQVLRGDWEEESIDTPARQPMTKAKSDPRVPNNGTGWAETSWYLLVMLMSCENSACEYL